MKQIRNATHCPPKVDLEGIEVEQSNWLSEMARSGKNLESYHNPAITRTFKIACNAKLLKVLVINRVKGKWFSIEGSTSHPPIIWKDHGKQKILWVTLMTSKKRLSHLDNCSQTTLLKFSHSTGDSGIRAWCLICAEPWTTKKNRRNS